MDSSLDGNDYDVCAKHGSTPFKYFCTTHWRLCCPNCVKPGGPHSTCKFVPSGLIEIPLFKEDMKKRSEKLARDIEGLQEVASYISGLSQDARSESVANACEVVRREFDLIRKAIDEKEKEIMSKLESAMEDRADELLEVVEPSSAVAQKGIDLYSTWDDHDENENIAVACDVKHECDKFYSTVTEKIDALCNVFTISSKTFAGPIVDKIRKLDPVKIKKRPYNVVPSVKEAAEGKVSAEWGPAQFECKYQVVKKNTRENTFEEVYEGEEPKCDIGINGMQKSVAVFTRFKVQEFTSSWKGPYTLKTGLGNKCWADCPDSVSESARYELKNDSFVVNKPLSGWSTVIGECPIKGTKAWNIRILNSKDNDGDKIYIGVAPVDIDQNVDNNYCKCGWYLDCYSSTLWSGLPHNYRGEEYVVRPLQNGRNVGNGSLIGVTMNTDNGKLSFMLNGIIAVEAYDGIPLDKPLVPCVVLCYRGDSVEYVAA